MFFFLILFRLCFRFFIFGVVVVVAVVLFCFVFLRGLYHSRFDTSFIKEKW